MNANHAVLPSPAVLLAQMLDVVALYDTRGRLTWINRVGAGCDREANIGKTLTEIMPPGTDLTTWHACFRAATLGATASLTLCWDDPEEPFGRARFYCRMAPCRDADGEIVGVIVSGHQATNGDACGVPGRFVLSRVDQEIVDTLRRIGPSKAATLARAMDPGHHEATAPSGLRLILAELTERGILHRRQGQYEVAADFVPYLPDALA